MAYIGQGIKNGTFTVLDTSGNTYNGSNVTFDLGTHVSSPAQLLVSHDGVIQKPVTDYTIATGGTQITFTTAPASGASIFITEISGAVGAPMNRDINGDELILDADADTSITADTDDQIDIRVGGTDQITIKDGALSPVTDNDIDLGTSSLEFKDAYFDGTVTSDAGLFDTLGVGTARDLGTLHVRSADSGGGANTSADELVVEGSGHAGMTILSGNANQGGIYFGDDGDDNIGYFAYNHNGNSLAIATNAAERMRIQSDGAVLIGKTSNTDTHQGCKFAEDAASIITVTDHGDVALILNRQNDDGSILSFKQANSQEGNIAVSGSTIAYNTFCGTHWSRLADNSKPTILRGTVLESIATMMDWYKAKFTVDDNEMTEDIALPNGKSVGDSIKHNYKGVEYDAVIEKQDNERLPMCKISDTEDSKAVYGVFMDWDTQPDDGVNDIYVAALGSFVVRIHKDETVAIGDYLVSNGDGTAKKQADDILRSSTIAKVTSTTKTHTHADDSYCVPCTLHCG